MPSGAVLLFVVILRVAMTYSTKHLIIIPGLGDGHGLFRIFIPLWSLMGYKVHIYVFGWNDDKTPSDVALNKLLAYIDDISAHGKKPLYLIGVSAGGVAAINALVSRPAHIAKITTISTPYRRNSPLSHALLKDSLDQAEAGIKNMQNELAARILSIHGSYDPIVLVALSKPKNIAHKALWTRGHAFTIFIALTFYRQTINRFFDS